VPKLATKSTLVYQRLQIRIQDRPTVLLCEHQLLIFDQKSPKARSRKWGIRLNLRILTSNSFFTASQKSTTMLTDKSWCSRRSCLRMSQHNRPLGSMAWNHQLSRFSFVTPDVRVWCWLPLEVFFYCLVWSILSLEKWWKIDACAGNQTPVSCCKFECLAHYTTKDHVRTGPLVLSGKFKPREWQVFENLGSHICLPDPSEYSMLTTGTPTYHWVKPFLLAKGNRYEVDFNTFFVVTPSIRLKCCPVPTLTFFWHAFASVVCDFWLTCRIQDLVFML
jgi:hypothetical protein